MDKIETIEQDRVSIPYRSGKVFIQDLMEISGNELSDESQSLIDQGRSSYNRKSEKVS